MSNGRRSGGFGPPGQREDIRRGERTAPRVIIGQAAGLAAVSMFVVVLVMCAVLVLSVPTWRELWKRLYEHWRWMLVVALALIRMSKPHGALIQHVTQEGGFMRKAWKLVIRLMCASR